MSNTIQSAIGVTSDLRALINGSMNFLRRNTPIANTASDAADQEAAASSLPGLQEGPADALRHIIGSAETRRRAGLAYAWSVVNGNEWLGRDRNILSGNAPNTASTAMDDHNNRIGLEIGGRAKTYDEVVDMSYDAMRRGIENDGSGTNNTPAWLSDRSIWRDPSTRTVKPSKEGLLELLPNPSSNHDYPYRGEEHRFLADMPGNGPLRKQVEALRLADLAEVPPEVWSEEDVRAVIRSQPYQDSRDPNRAAWHARVRVYFEEKVRREQEQQARDEGTGAAVGEDRGTTTDVSNRADWRGTGTVDVSACTRRGKHGAVQVSAHQRSAPG